MQFLTSGRELLAVEKDFKLVGRDLDLKRLSAVLMRNRAASVILVGPGGVGATALCMGLQAYKDNPEATFDIVSKRLFWLNTDELFAQGSVDLITKGFNSVISVLKRTPDSILIIEDTRDFIEACRNNGCSHFINSLNACLKAGDTQVILEAKDQDIDMIMAAHSDMRECYTLIDLHEPVGDDLLQIATSNVSALEKHHGIKVAVDAVTAAIELTNKYRTRDASLNRAQPERSVTLIDRALASYRLEAHKRDPKVLQLLTDGENPSSETIAVLDADFAKTQKRLKELYRLQREAEISIIDLEEQIEKIKAEEPSQADVPAEPESSRIKMFSRVASASGFESPKIRVIREQIAKLQSAANENRAEFDVLTEQINSKLLLSKDYILSEFSRLSGIPANKLNENEREKLRNLEATLNARVFGQSSVIAKIANAIKVARVGQRNGNKPQASFLIMGPSGTGKTEVSKALAYALKDDEAALTRFDMSEYMEKHSVAKLIGAPAGYEGSERGGILTNAMRSNPNRIILFDEIEKADPAVFDIFLQILSDGRLTDNHGRTVSFSESVIIMTTNIGQPFFLDTNLSDEESEALANQELDSKYRPEFLNRFNGRKNIFSFRRLELNSIEKIVRRELNDLNRAYKDRIEVVISDSTVSAFCKDQYDPKNGARGLQGFIISNIEPIIANLLLEDTKQGNKLVLEYDSTTKTFKSSLEE